MTRRDAKRDPRTDGATEDAAVAPTLADPASDQALAPTVAKSTGRDADDPLGPTEGPGPVPESQRRQRVRGKGDLIGPFVVLHELGRGGMGVVVAAYDAELDRKVAIKVLNPSMLGDTAASDATARLRREAQAMAKIAHPNVITVHQVGVDAGQIYLVMELMVGGTLSTWLNKEPPPSWQEVLRAFDRAGQGLMAAHEAGLVHRDFKPDNILMGEGDRILVTDFGLVGEENSRRPAPAHHSSALGADSPSLTVTGAVMGTPSYMAPEQHSGLKAGPAADQFAFCVALYQALYRQHPFGGSSYEALRHRVLEEHPREPEGDLTPPWLWPIIARGLSREPAHRHPSMGALLQALRPPQPATRPRPWQLVLILCAALALAGVGAALWTGGSTTRCGEAGASVKSAWGANQREQVSKRHGGDAVLSRLLSRLDSYAKQWATMRQRSCEATFIRGKQSGAMLDKRTACLDERLHKLEGLVHRVVNDKKISGPEAMRLAFSLPDLAPCEDLKALAAKVALPSEGKARLIIQEARRTLAKVETHRAHGEYEEGIALAKQLLAQAETLSYPPLTAQIHYQLGLLHSRQHQLASAEQSLRNAVNHAAQGRDYQLEAEAWVSLIYVIGHLQGRVQEGGAMEAAAKAALGRIGQPKQLAARLEGNVGLLLLGDPKRRQQAPKRLAAATALFIALEGKESLNVATAQSNLAKAYNDLEQPKKAEAQTRAALHTRRRLLGPHHPDVATSLNLLGLALAGQGQHPQAIAQYRRALAIQNGALPKNHPRKANVLNNLGLSLKSVGEPKAAQAAYERGLAIMDKAHGEKHLESVALRVNLGDLLLSLGKRRPAWAHFAMALAIVEHRRGRDHISAAPLVDKLGQFLRMLDQPAQAVSYFSRALAIRQKAFGPMHLHVANTLNNRGAAQLDAGKPKEAHADLSQARMLYARLLGENHPEVATGDLHLGIALEAQKKYLAAEKHYRAALLSFEASQGTQSVRLNQALLGLGDMAKRRQAWQEAEALYRRRVAILRTAGSKHAIALMGALTSLGELLTERRRYGEAIKLLEQARVIGATDTDHARAAVVTFALARAIWNSKKNRARALDLARSSRKVFAAAGDRATGNLETANRWLAGKRL